MEKSVPTSWLNKVLLAFSICSALLCLFIQEWVVLAPLPVYVSISWAIFVIILSVWLSCFLLRLTLKANSPINIEFFNKWLHKRIEKSSKLIEKTKEDRVSKTDSKTFMDKFKNKHFLLWKKSIKVTNLTREINLKCLSIWYTNISSDKSFPHEAEELLRKLLARLIWELNLIDTTTLTSKLANVLILHLKEYRRALRRVEKGAAQNLEQAYKCSHPGSRSPQALEHMMRRLVTMLAQEFLQWELTSSLPCKLILSILAKKLLLTIEAISYPQWIFEHLFKLLQNAPKEDAKTETKENGTLLVALGDGITSATAAVIPRALPKSSANSSPWKVDKDSLVTVNGNKPALRLEGLTMEHRGLWGKNTLEMELDADEDKASPVYEEPTDFATTIARLRSLLQQKSTVTTPLHPEEKSYVMYEGSQFTNLSIPWTEFRTAPDGSQQLLYCIQFDDIEQHGEDLFENTIATVRRQYSDFAQLHSNLAEVPSLAGVMSDLVLPEGGRVELESYLKILCTRLANECPPQLRHFLRPNSGANKKADVVAPRFDRFLAKTVSGVFNTLRTVVPGFEIDHEEDNIPMPTLMPLADIPWRFIEDIKSKSLPSKLQQLIAERTDYCSVDTAYEAVDSMEGNDDSESVAHWRDTVKSSDDEEVDELDSDLVLTCAAIDIICELLAGIGSTNTFQQEAVVRWTKLLFGSVTEPMIRNAIHLIFDYWDNIPLSHNSSRMVSGEPIIWTRKAIADMLFGKIPYDIKLIFGEEDTQRALEYLLSSYEIKKINMDLNMQILEILASQLLVSCRMDHEDVPQ